jgi:hypothetical protein
MHSKSWHTSLKKIKKILNKSKKKIISCATTFQGRFMMKIFLSNVFIFCCLNFSVCNSKETDYSLFNSVEEIIEYETAEILKISTNDHAALSDAYCTRGESFLLGENYELALLDFEKSYELAKFISTEDLIIVLFRPLFGLALVYGHLNLEEQFTAAISEMRAILETCSCCDREQNTEHLFSKNHSELNFHERFNYISNSTKIPDQPILGPDHISIRDCIDRVDATQNAAKLLIVKAKAEFQYILNNIIDDLAVRARNCCRAGGIWKTCLQPIVNRWHQWNEKWKIFGIPPDPAWD